MSKNKFFKGKRQAQTLFKKWNRDVKFQGVGECDLCGQIRKLVFDHDHETLLFRGWLCDPCNRSLGILGDTPSTILKALNYVNRLRQYDIKQDTKSKLLFIKRFSQ